MKYSGLISILLFGMFLLTAFFSIYFEFFHADLVVIALKNYLLKILFLVFFVYVIVKDKFYRINFRVSRFRFLERVIYVVFIIFLMASIAGIL